MPGVLVSASVLGDVSRILDRTTANPNLAYAVAMMWDYALPFLEYLRGKDGAYFDEWKYLYDHHRHRIIAAARKPRGRGSR